MVILVLGTFFYFAAIGNSAVMVVPSPPSTSGTSSEQMTSSPPAATTINNNNNDNNNNMIENNPENSANIEMKYLESSSEVKTQSTISLFDHLQQGNKMFTKKNADGTVKLFYYYTKDEPIEIPLEEGDINSYQNHNIGGQNYYPLILGIEEARIMREEGIFAEVGDPIKDFFGKNVVIVGIMKKTNGVLDLTHLIPLTSGELN